jgi:hypothetical protein
VKLIAAILIFILPFAAASQVDSLYRSRRLFVGTCNATVGIGMPILLNEVWYKQYPRTSFHFFNDADNWGYMDKLGHAFVAYKLTNINYIGWQWAGMPKRKNVWLSGALGFGHLLSVEILDGFSEGWGFSPADLTANTLGVGLFVSQELAWNDQRFRMKFSYKPSKWAELRPDVLGSNFPERFLKDYNAQSYWISTSPGKWLRGTNVRIPEWFQVSVGYSRDEMLNGDHKNYVIDGFTYTSKPEFAVSLDLDWSQLPYKRLWVKKLLQPLNAIKIPFPSVYWRNGVCYLGMF